MKFSAMIEWARIPEPWSPGFFTQVWSPFLYLLLLFSSRPWFFFSTVTRLGSRYEEWCQQPPSLTFRNISTLLFTDFSDSLEFFLQGKFYTNKYLNSREKVGDIHRPCCEIRERVKRKTYIWKEWLEETGKHHFAPEICVLLISHLKTLRIVFFNSSDNAH